jgi:hypothetical protein
MANSSDIDAALLAKLGSDPALLALMPNGVYWGIAGPGATRFVIVSLVDSDDPRVFEARDETRIYLVKAVGLSTDSPDMDAAGDRIDALLHWGTLTVSGYTLMVIERELYIRDQEAVSDVDPKIRWYHRGGHYRVMMALGT